MSVLSFGSARSEHRAPYQGDVQVPIEHAVNWQHHSRRQTDRIFPAATISLHGRRRMRGLADIEEFITGHRESSSLDFERVLATRACFTDIVDSRAARHDGRSGLAENWLGQQINCHSNGREASRDFGQVDRRWNLATVDGPAARSAAALCVRNRLKQIGLSAACGSAYRGDRNQRAGISEA